MALSSFDTLVDTGINQTSSSVPATGTVNGVVAGELVIVEVNYCNNSGTQTPGSWTVTLGGVALSPLDGIMNGAVVGALAVFYGVAASSGNLALSITPNSSIRSIEAKVRKGTGYDPTTPLTWIGGDAFYTSDALASTFPSGYAAPDDGTLVCGLIAVHGGDTTALAVSGADGSTVGQTSTNAFQATEWGHCHKAVPTALGSSVTFAWTWATNADRGASAAYSIKPASGGPSTITGTVAATTAPTTSAAAAERAVVGSVAATAPAATASATGSRVVEGSLDALAPPATATLAAERSVTGALSAVSPAVTAALTGERVVTGSLAGVAAPAQASVSQGVQTVTGSVNAVTPAATAQVVAERIVLGAVNVSTPPASASMSGVRRVTGSVDAVAPAATAAAGGSSIVTGSLGAVVPAVAASVTAERTVVGSVSAVSPAATSAISGERTVVGSLSASLPVVAGAFIAERTVVGSVAVITPAAQATATTMKLPSVRLGQESDRVEVVTGSDELMIITGSGEAA